MDGQVLILPIKGNGKSNITMVDLKTKHDQRGEIFEKDGEKYFRIKEYKIKFEPRLVMMNFTNLFNGDKQLGNNMNSFLNENWQVVFDELKSGYEESFSKVFKSFANQLFTQVPVDKIFLP